MDNQLPTRQRKNSNPSLSRVSHKELPAGPQDTESHFWRLASCVLIVKKTFDGYEYLTVQTQKRPTENDLPGGKVEDGETYHQAAIRELEEETHLKADEDHLIFLHEGSDGGDQLDPPKTPFWVKTFFVTEYQGTEYPGPEEISVSWRPLSELKNHKNPVWQEYHHQVYHKYLEHLHIHHITSKNKDIN